MNQETVAINAAHSGDLEQALMAFGETLYADLSRYRFAEERSWMEAALFYQRRQWLNWNEQRRQWTVQKPDSKKPRPMPVSNYFARTINQNANALGAELPKMLAAANDDDPANRRAADMAQKAKDAIDVESGMKVLNPILAKHVPLWGLGVTRDLFDTSLSAGVTKVPQVQIATSMMLACAECAGTYELNPEMTGDGSSPVLCPQCGSANTQLYPEDREEITEVEQYSTGKIATEVVPIFEVYLPRDCQNPNVAKKLLRRTRKPLSTLRRQYGERAEDIKSDSQSDLHAYYYESLKGLVNQAYVQEQAAEASTVTEVWADWDELPDKLQDRITEQAPELVEGIQRAGLFIIYAPGVMLDWGVNPLFDEQRGKRHFPYTFFAWEMDPASVYPKGIATDLVPLQKRLNRIDSLIELAMMSNAAGKWLWPKTQTTKPPTGSPNDVIEYDPIGDGKVPPSFVQPSPIHPVAFQLRMQILADINALGLTEGVTRGQAPAGTPFRAVAYLGAKAAEQIGTQRALWESAHQLRYEKCLLMARLYWDEPRLVRSSGMGKTQVTKVSKLELLGDYDIEFLPNSSKPKTVEDKAQAIGMLLQAQLIDPTDPSVRDYIVDMVDMDGLNLVDHLQFSKAERDLEKIKRGEQPLPSPFTKWDIALKVVANYCLTEQFESDPPETQQAIMAYAQFLNAQVTQVTMQSQLAGAVGAPPAAANALANVLAGKSAAPGSELQAIPGEQIEPQNTETAAVTEGDQMASQIG